MHHSKFFVTCSVVDAHCWKNMVCRCFDWILNMVKLQTIICFWQQEIWTFFLPFLTTGLDMFRACWRFDDSSSSSFIIFPSQIRHSQTPNRIFLELIGLMCAKSILHPHLHVYSHCCPYFTDELNPNSWHSPQGLGLQLASRFLSEHLGCWINMMWSWARLLLETSNKDQRKRLQVSKPKLCKLGVEAWFAWKPGLGRSTKLSSWNRRWIDLRAFQILVEIASFTWTQQTMNRDVKSWCLSILLHDESHDESPILEYTNPHL